MFSRQILSFACVLALAQPACSRRPPEAFIAFERDFQGFRSWPGGAFEELPARGQTHYAGDQRYFVSDTTAARRALALPEPRGWRSGVGELAEWLSAARSSAPRQAAEVAA